ncbi:MarR family transcriptional regulator [Natronorubrum sp. A-ect3]|uniref:MarR family transcriptional regulator n=1 Tax=Natronorubrum sp. A-ect3 TaxID=3242698 RepID=UPI00359DC1D5
MDFLGFDTSDLNDSPKKIKLKTYADSRHKQRSESDPLRHWKLEAAIYGAYHWDRWEKILHHAQRIVCSHAIWAGIREDELIPDEWFLAGQQSQNSLTFKHPADRREQLTEFWHSEEFERTVAGRLFHSRTKSYYDVLCVLLNRPNDQITYQEIADEIGLTKDSIGRIAGKLEEDGIVIRCFSAVGFVRWQSQQAKETVRSLLDRDMTEAERRENIEERAAERRRNRDAQRESESESNEGDKDDTDDGSHDTVDAEKLAERLLSGDIDPEEVVLQSPE